MQMETHGLSKDWTAVYRDRHYRLDVQGLRALSALLILVYHLWTERISGGVDVFFVLSGFMMGGLLLREYAQSGRLYLWAFWGRIARRVLPSVTLVLLATIGMALAVMPIIFWKELVVEVFASSLHLQNIQLIRSSADYLARDIPPSPVQHFWALSIQMQFYWVLPFVMLIGLFVARRLNAVQGLVGTLVLLILLSFTHNLLYTLSHPEAAYFSPLTRGWQFLLGVLMAVILPYLRMSLVLSGCLTLLGVAGLLLTGWLIPQSLNFPGWVSLLPVMSAVLFLAAGAQQNVGNPLQRFLRHPIAVFLGGISFTIYLWHWPLLIMSQYYWDTTGLNLWQGLSVIGLSILFAWLTERFVGAPLMARLPYRGWAPHRFGLLAFALLFTLNFTWWQQVEQQRESAILYAQSVPMLAMTPELVSLQREGEHLSREILLAASTLSPYSNREGCHQDRDEAEVLHCSFGNPESMTMVVLVGGSHSLQWFQALEPIAVRHDWHLVNVTKTACPFGATEVHNASCHEWNQAVREWLLDVKPDAVVTTSTRADGFANNLSAPEYLPASYVEHWQSLTDVGIPVIGIRDNPWLEMHAAECVEVFDHDLSQCAVLQQDVLLSVSPAEVHSDLITEVDMSDYFCVDGVCPLVIDDTPVYRDTDHLSVLYVTRLHKALEQRLKERVHTLFQDGSS
ncbi:MAG: acyltransferase [Idiomarina sp.]|nr:acyltransferase [Idiomarina sp.]